MLSLRLLTGSATWVRPRSTITHLLWIPASTADTRRSVLPNCRYSMAALLIYRRAGRCAHGVTSRPATARSQLSPPAPEAKPSGNLREETLRYRHPHVQGEWARTMVLLQKRAKLES